MKAPPIFASGSDRFFDQACHFRAVRREFGQQMTCAEGEDPAIPAILTAREIALSAGKIWLLDKTLNSKAAAQRISFSPDSHYPSQAEWA